MLPDFEPGLMNQELHNVTEWFELGSNLGLSKDDLDVVREKEGRENIMQCRFAMLTLWYNKCSKLSWSDLIKALMLTNRERLAHQLALKYSECIHVFMFIIMLEMIHVHIYPLQELLSHQHL